jgi:hypothetical protein
MASGSTITLGTGRPARQMSGRVSLAALAVGNGRIGPKASSLFPETPRAEARGCACPFGAEWLIVVAGYSSTPRRGASAPALSYPRPSTPPTMLRERGREPYRLRLD